MKNLICAVAIFLAVFPATLLCDDSQFTLSPARPKSGDQLTLTYNAASRMASLKDVKEITGQIMIFSGSALPVLVEVPLKHEGSLWSGSCILSQKDAAL